MKIWLDDVRTPPDGDWTWCKNTTQVKALLSLSNLRWDVEVISLDNDLGEGLDEGYTVLNWLEEKRFNNLNFTVPKKIHIHSANPVARMRMEKIIEKNGWN